MTGTLLRFYVHEHRRHRHRLLYDWLLEDAKQLGIRRERGRAARTAAASDTKARRAAKPST